MDESTFIERYINNLSSKEKIALEIAKQQLESSFCLERSLGFINYTKKEKEKEKDTCVEET